MVWNASSFNWQYWCAIVHQTKNEIWVSRMRFDAVIVMQCCHTSWSLWCNRCNLMELSEIWYKGCQIISLEDNIFRCSVIGEYSAKKKLLFPQSAKKLWKIFPIFFTFRSIKFFKIALFGKKLSRLAFFGRKSVKI